MGMASWGQLQPPDAIHYPDMKKKSVAQYKQQFSLF